MKVRRTITIDAKLDMKIKELIDKEIEKALKNINPSKKAIDRIQKKYNYSRMVEELIKKGLLVKDFGF